MKPIGGGIERSQHPEPPRQLPVSDFMTPQRTYHTNLGEGARTVSVAATLAAASVVEVTYPPNADFDTHQHEDAYLCLTVRGSYTEWVGSRRLAVGSGRELCYAEDSRHAVRTGSEGLRMLHVTDPARCGWSGEASPLRLGILYQMSAAIRDLGRTPLDDSSLLHLESLVRELRPPAGSDSTEPCWLRRARARIREGYREPLTLGDLAMESGVHPSHLTRAFRQHHGMTAGEYLRRIRVAVAARRLAESPLPLSQVALECGFADQSHMGRHLQRYMGITPNAVRAHCRG